MRYLVTFPLITVFLVGCANVEDKQNHRDAQIEMVERQMIARQRMELDRAQAQAQWAAAMAAVAAASPENADAIAVGLAVAAVKNADEGAKDAPVVTLQRDVNEAREWAKVLAAPMLGTLTQLGIAGIQADVTKTQSDNMTKVQINEDNVDGQQYEVLGDVATAVSSFSSTAIENAGGNTTYTYTVSDEAMLDMSTDSSVSGDTNTDSYNTSGDTNADSYNTQGDTNADSYNTQGDTTTDSSDNSDNSDNSVANPAAP